MQRGLSKSLKISKESKLVAAIDRFRAFDFYLQLIYFQMAYYKTKALLIAVLSGNKSALVYFFNVALELANFHQLLHFTINKF